MKIVVLDLEMNQPSDKIIQIGAVLWDIKRGVKLDKFDMICNPGELPSPEISALTGISATAVDSGVPLKIAIETFWAWVKNSECAYQLGAWGGDVWWLLEQGKALGVHPGKPPRVLNIKEMSKVYRSALPQSKKGGGLLNTLKAFGLEFEGRQHDAYTDAYNTARLLQHFRDMVNREICISRIYENSDS